MRRTLFAVLPLLVCACDDYRGPNLSLPTNRSDTAQQGADRNFTRKGPMVYGGKTAEQWGQVLKSSNREEVIDACRALRVMGREGRQHLFQGLDSPNHETRRLCLETMTIAEYKKMS